MPVIKERYKDYLKSLSGKEKAQDLWPWCCKEATCMLVQDEPEGVCEEVEKFRQQLFEEQTPTLLDIEDLMKDGMEGGSKRVLSLQW